MQKRIVYLDHAKAILIILVVLGHLLEKISFHNSKAIYLCIYAFHMPAFIFISGLCYKKGADIRKLICNYFLFQSLYLLCDIWQKGLNTKITYTTPVWIMWYLLSLSIWYIICNYLPSTKRKGILILGISFLLAVGIGFDTTIGRYMSLSRTIVYFPFFWSGVYIKENYFDGFDFFLTTWSKRNGLIKVNILLVSLVSFYYLFKYQESVKKYWFYETNAYNEKGYDIKIRLLVLCMAAVLTMGLLILVPKKENKVLVFLGKNTLPIYLYHGLFIKIMAMNQGFKGTKYPILSIGAMTFLLVGVFSMDPIGKIVQIVKTENRLKKA